MVPRRPPADVQHRPGKYGRAGRRFGVLNPPGRPSPTSPPPRNKRLEVHESRLVSRRPQDAGRLPQRRSEHRQDLPDEPPHGTVPGRRENSLPRELPVLGTETELTLPTTCRSTSQPKSDAGHNAAVGWASPTPDARRPTPSRPCTWDGGPLGR